MEMEPLWLVAVVTLCIAMLANSLFHLLFGTKNIHPNLPPGTFNISTFMYLYKYPSIHGLLPIANRLLHTHNLGPIFTLYVGSQPHVFLADLTLAREALVKHASTTSDRFSTGKAAANGIGGAPYGPTWTALRRNLTPHFINPSNMRTFSSTREWALGILVDRLRSHSQSGPEPVRIINDLYFSIFSLQIAMCFGIQLHDENHVQQVMHVIRQLVETSPEFPVLGYSPKLTGLVFRRRWRKLRELQRSEEEVLIPLIRARRAMTNPIISRAYVDGIFDLRLPEGRGLTEAEIMRMCSSFLIASTELPITTLHWIMAELVKNPRVQSKLRTEMEAVIGANYSGIVREEEIDKVGYVKAVVKEGLRIHPPGHLVIPHRVAEDDVEVGGYSVPKDAVLNVMVAEIGRDPRVWEDPMEFRPERFDDIDGVEKMVAFGVGRRSCPGREMAMGNMEYFVGNLVWCFGWEAGEGGVDLGEKDELVMAMNTPLCAKLHYRFRDE